MKRIIFIPQNYSLKRSFIKDFRIFFLEDKIELKRVILKKTGASQRCDWADALEKMDHDTGSVWKER
jgi:hypothetical protein